LEQLMPARQRQRTAPTDDWEQLQLLTAFPEQRTYELIRPIVLFGQSPSERARQTATPQRTLSRQAAQFEATGILSLFAPSPSTTKPRLAPEIREAVAGADFHIYPDADHDSWTRTYSLSAGHDIYAWLLANSPLSRDRKKSLQA
jgi:hypothetical protein